MKKNILMFVMLVAVLCTSCTEYRYVYVPTSSTTPTMQQQTAGVAVATYTVSGYIKKVSYSGEIWIAVNEK